MTAGSTPSSTRSALIVVDMQNGFCHPEGSLPRWVWHWPMWTRGAESALAVEQARQPAFR